MNTRNLLSSNVIRKTMRGLATMAALLTGMLLTTAAKARNDILFKIEPGGLGLLTIDGDPFDVGIAAGVVSLTVDDPHCVATINTPCTYTVNFLSLMLENFSLDGTSIAGLTLAIDPTVAVDDGGGIFLPPGTPVASSATLNGEVSTLTGETLATGLSIIVDPQSQLAIVTGAFQGNLHGAAVDAFVVVNAITPFTNLPPIANAGPDKTVVGCGATVAVPLSGTASDPPNGEIRAVHWRENGRLLDQGLTATVQLAPGVHELTLEVYDAFSARGTDTVTVEVVAGDETGPAFTSVPADITTTSCGTLNLGTATAADACGGTVTITNNRPAKFSPGTTVVTWTATDQAGNRTTATQRVTLVLTDNRACCPAGTRVIVGTSNNDTLTGTSGADCILGLGAQDTINGLGGDDFISAGDGDDVIDAGTGNDRVFGGSGQDRLTGNSGDDQLNGGDGDDVCRGGIGHDMLRGGQGQDQLFGEDGNDQLFGDDGDDRLDGGNGDDTLVGGGLHDTCIDGSGTNTFATCKSPAPNSCVDLSKNGTETDVDCGGACSTKCPNGKACIGGSDCQSSLCSGGVCLP